MSFKSFLVGQKVADPQQEGLTQSAEDVLSNQVAQGNQSQGDIVNKTLEGTNTQGMIQGQQQSIQKENDALAMQQPDFIKEGLQRRAQEKFGSSQIALKNKAKMDSAGRLAQAQGGAFGAMVGRQKINNDAYKRKIEDYNQKRAARNQIISTIFTGAGAAAGLMMNNPQAGAKAGAAAGPGTATAGQSYTDYGSVS